MEQLPQYIAAADGSDTRLKVSAKPAEVFIGKAQGVIFNEDRIAFGSQSFGRFQNSSGVKIRIGQRAVNDVAGAGCFDGFDPGGLIGKRHAIFQARRLQEAMC